MTRFREIKGVSREETITSFSQQEEEGPGLNEQFVTSRPSWIPPNVFEQFIRMRDTLLDERREPPVKVVGVTSAKQGEGKTTVSICLALASAVSRPGRVLLVDGNLRSPTVHSFLHVPEEPGLAEMIQEGRPAEEVIRVLQEVPLKILTSGVPVLTPTELFSHDRFQKRILEFREAFDLVIVDTPSTNQCMDFELIGKRIDGMILVLQADKTQLSTLQEARSRMESAQIPILGVTMNRLRNPIPRFLSKRFGPS